MAFRVHSSEIGKRFTANPGIKRQACQDSSWHFTSSEESDSFSALLNTYTGCANLGKPPGLHFFLSHESLALAMANVKLGQSVAHEALRTSSLYILTVSLLTRTT